MYIENNNFQGMYLMKSIKRFPIDLRSFIIVVSIFTIITLCGFFFAYEKEVQAIKHARAVEEIMYNEIHSRATSIYLRDLFIELQVFASHIEVKKYMKNRDEESRLQIEEESLSLCKISGIFDQVRLLDNDGMELIRVNYNNGNPEVVPRFRLQNKRSRYYFQEALKLKQGEIYVSPFDLNVENGEIEQPLKPMIRVCTPVYDDSGQRLGIAILNYLGQQILDELKNVEAGHYDIMLLNEAGYWMFAPDKNLEWTFMYEDKKSISFASMYPEEWKKISGSPRGQFSSARGEFTYSTIEMSYGSQQGIANKRIWKLINLYPRSQVAATNASILEHQIGIFAAIFLIILFSGITRARYVRSRELANRNLRLAKLEAEEANRSKSDFLAKMSHEIRTPMNAIIGLTLLALKTQLSTKQKDYLNKISLSANNLLDLINDILDFSKIEANEIKLEEIDFDLDEVLNNVSSILNLKAEEKGIELLLLEQSDVPNLIVGDPLRLSQVLMNLAGNAIKFTDQGEVLISVELVERLSEKAEIKFSIKDTGIGISKEQQEILFQPFSQADGSITRRFGGTGLGLVICQKFVELMGGTIELESEPEKGSIFSFTIPFRLQADQTEWHFIYPKEILKMRVLVVDDSKVSLLVLSKILESFSFEVTTAESGREALDLIHENDAKSPFRLVITDWKISDIDGFHLTKKIKGSKELQNIPKVILVTAYSYEEVRYQVKQLQLDGFMLKPVNRSILFDTVMNIFCGEEYKSQRGSIVETHKIPSNIAGANILVVEDNSINQQIAREILEDAGVKVTIAGNGREAVEILEKKSFDLVLMDLQMPEMDGFQAVNIIRSQLFLKKLPILAMTAHALVGDREKSLEAGMNDHITKPINPELLLETLSRWLPGEENAEGDAEEVLIIESEKEAVVFPEIPRVDTEQGLHRVRNNVELYTRLLVDFAQNSTLNYDNIIRYIEDNNYAEARLEVHALKGITGNLGVDRLHNILKEMESFLIGEKQIPAHLMDDFKTELMFVADAVLQILNPVKKEAGSDSTIDIDALIQIRSDLERVSLLLAQQDLEAKDILKKIKPTLEKAAPAYIVELNHLVDQFNFKSAKKKVEQLLHKSQRSV